MEKEEETVCEQGERQRRSDFNIVGIIFPQDQVTIGHATLFVFTDLSAYKLPFKDEEGKAHIIPSVIGCVVYEVTVDKKPHHTWFAFEAGLPPPPNWGSDHAPDRIPPTG